ncbi:helix-hairpin-helix domain-containing protein [Zeaxanthinibacter sp. PT1]|uniref:helix-hairpin-helix domain-containing protein n=1 Tax=Zeaxanthinibacter TaxID=561554 RepID=UPI00234905FB|nr:helix-hairpin-helix domain-containing protein [Zeaxanthinibacter sp. PT1]MDC6351847.1 helix-hairpin-helix domain-containing protein [Zeaxanthinibacter sp. PT1]
MKNKKPHLVLSKRERSGVFFLLLFVLIVQGVKWWIIPLASTKSDSFILDEVLQARHDSIVASRAALKNKIYPFNPNYLDDARGYRLGLSAEQLDRLYAYREKGYYVNSAAEFAKITGIPDTLLENLSPYFSFPHRGTDKSTKPESSIISSPRKVIPRDINTATASDLQEVRGIGPVLSSRVIRFRDALGGFLVDEQLYDVYGLDSATVLLLLERYRISEVPDLVRINLNTASVEELASLVYIPYGLAWKIVRYRESVGEIRSLDELTQFEDFPSDKIDRIGLYLFL